MLYALLYVVVLKITQSSSRTVKDGRSEVLMHSLYFLFLSVKYIASLVYLKSSCSSSCMIFLYALPIVYSVLFT